jgi:hypothetical protein
MNNSVFFVELTQQEIKSKLSQFGSGVVLFWVPSHLHKTNDVCYEVKQSVQYDSTNHSFILLSDLSLNCDQLYLCRFNIGDVTYFSAGNWEIFENGYLFKISKKIYRYEKRRKDRLLTYPHRQVYLCLINSVAPTENSNVVTLQKGGDVLKKLYYQLNPEEAVGVRKLRVLDISVEGISFLVGKGETKFLEHDDVSFEIEFNNQRFPISLDQQLYSVSYLDIYSKSSSLRKIGATYSGSEKLQELIEHYLHDDSLIRFDVKHGFEDFILRQLR